MTKKKSTGKKGFTEGYETYDTSEGYGNEREWRRAFQNRMNGTAADVRGDGEKSPWEILEISPTASQTGIKRAYRRLMKQWHPDVNKDSIEEATAKSQEITVAYEKLTKSK